ncbi:hypothetical protein FHE66_03045 [Georgenia sp. 311]|uniref:Integral membrane protein n=1 Tax=Georgenia wutianyii TaxID=2585135 RepID=A0ABX5VLX0_9MICO|nr:MULTISPECIES: hypothetical protein [Georgenia]QDB79486.1 hypothetical protein FE251_08965 [Georgenia wutianyii]TNC19460.1 hypothetical protein FHE66_03045 [Georgenia sp. 311]
MSQEPLRTAPATDDRPPARGAGLLVVAVYVIFALAATARASVQLVRDAAEAPLAYGLSGFAAVVYVVAAVALAHNGRRMRRMAWVAVSIEMLGVLVVGTLSFLTPELFPRDTVWSHFGSGYGFVPLVLPALGLFWLWRSSPGRVARASESH